MNMFKMKRFGIALIAVFAVLALCTVVISGQGWAQQKKFLADRHKDRGMECSACHKESPPQKAVPSEVCKGCHDEEKLAMKSAEKFGRQNPHDNHLGAIACEQCHHGHKPSVDACAKCHQFGFKVP
ncbi:MAG: cytochrome c3 family protein [Syntrophaceae bacterium]